MASSKHVFEPFEALADLVDKEGLCRWTDVEPHFLKVVEQFDTEYSLGGHGTGWYQSKARYVNDLIVQLLQNLSKKPFAFRCKRDSRLFAKIDMDICYPKVGTPLVGGEVKILGTPPHPKNRGKARGAAADLHKRIREVALTSVDFKAAHAQPVPMSSLQQWVDATMPGYFSFWAIRAANDSDLAKVRTTLASLRTYCNGVAAVFYMPKRPIDQTTYEVRRLPDLSIDNVLREIAQRVA
ncbi:MAG TPA: hypothetical protein VEL28_07365 [Candidatus Binatia bacterium]|nr:hypothetical protein [Candidatus Binatia bacterium]